ncbi:MAG: SMC-Scp complex subunit ScpB, partial [Actinomycetes bacterium]
MSEHGEEGPAGTSGTGGEGVPGAAGELRQPETSSTGTGSAASSGPARPADVPTPGSTGPAADEPAPVDLDPDRGAATGPGAAGPDRADEPQPALAALLEAVLLVTDEPVPAVTLAQVVERPTEEVLAELQRLAEEYAVQGRGFELRTAAGGWRLYTRADCA